MKKVLCALLAFLTAFSCVCLSGCGEEKLALEEVVDFVLEVEAGRDVKILQLTDIQIIDSSQMRSPTRLNSRGVEMWKPEISPILLGNSRERR